MKEGRMLPPGFADIETYYTALCAFLSDPFITWLVNVHVNDSYTENLVGNIPPEWATLSSWDAIVDIALLRDNSSYPPSLVRFIDNCRGLMIVREPCREETPLEHFDDYLLHGMKVKKIHEVEALAPYIARMSRDLNVPYVIDVGAGQGYFSQVLAVHYDLKVLGIESSEHNTRAASERADELIHREREKRIRNGTLGMKPIGDFVALTEFVSANTNLDTLLTMIEGHSASSGGDDGDGGGDHGDSDSENITRPSLLTGLHCCGDLSTNLIKYFISPSCTAKALVLVSCCYNLLSNRGEVDRSGCTVTESAFPLQEGFSTPKLSRAARNLAAYSPSEPEPFKASLAQMHLRSLLQVLLRDRFEEIYHAYKVPGNPMFRLKNLKLQDDSFASYASAALKKIRGYPLEDSTDAAEVRAHIHALEEEYRHRSTQPGLLFSLRCAVAPLVEACILIDRVIHLQRSSEISRAELVPLFDPSVSPRNMAIVAYKK